jgi:uncharacterized membrane protein
VAIDPGALFTIVLMALATYVTRAGGLWLASRFDLSERAGAWLDQIPGAILVSLVAPTVLMGGPVEVLAAIVVVIVSLKTGSLLAAMVTGVGSVLALQALQANLL